MTDAACHDPGIHPRVGSLGESDARSLAERRDDERGQGLVEYGLILILIAIVVIVVVGVVGHQANNVFSNVSNGLSA